MERRHPLLRTTSKPAPRVPRGDHWARLEQALADIDRKGVPPCLEIQSQLARSARKTRIRLKTLSRFRLNHTVAAGMATPMAMSFTPWPASVGIEAYQLPQHVER
jgi:hypothetical protein